MHAGDGDDEMFLFGSQWAAADLVTPEPSKMPGPAAGTAQAPTEGTKEARWCPHHEHEVECYGRVVCLNCPPLFLFLPN